MGNYFIDDNSVGSYISPSEARELKPAGPCKKVPGLMYSSEYPDFNPFTWKNKCTHKMKSVRFILPSESFGEKDEFIDVHRYSDLTVTSQLHELSASIASRHKVVCDKKSWNSKGSMFAAGFHMDRFKKVKAVCHYPITGSNKDPSLISDEDSQLFFAANIFEKQFGERDIGYHEMVNLQRDIWPDGPEIPARWMVSSNLGNPKHIDNDYSDSRSYAVWIRNTKEDYCLIALSRG